MTALGPHAIHPVDPASAARYRASGAWSDMLLTDYLDSHARAYPSRIAFVDSRRRIEYAALQSGSYRLADALRRRGVGAGTVVAIQLPNWIEFAIWHLALVRLGAVTCLITPMSRDRDVAAMLRIARASWFVITDSFRGFDYVGMAANLSRDTAQLADLENIVVVEGSAGATCRVGMDFGSLMEEGRDDAATRALVDGLRPHPDDLAEIVFTSGSTGDPKGVLHTHNTLIAPQLAMAASLRLKTGAVLHMASTLGHQAGFLNGVRLPVQIGGTCILQDVWSPDVFASLVARHGISVSGGSATFLLDLLRSPELGRRDLSSFRVFRCGGGPIPIALVREAETRLPRLKVVRSWGQTENGVVTIARLDDTLELRADNDGRVQPGMTLRIVGADHRLAPMGVEGRLQCRGAAMCVGYADDPKTFRESFEGEWFDTGDLGRWVATDQPGAPAVRITGRVRDIIIRGGENIPVSYVENVLFEDERVLEVAIVAMPDERLGERACAFVIPRPGAAYDADMMRAFLAAQGVATQYWPERLEVVDSLPRTANGKVNKASLRAMLQAAPANAPSR